MENSFKSKALYYQLVDLLQERIEKQMIPHDKLPSERELTAQYGVSRTTVRLALQELESSGYIYRRHGKGTFVSDIQKKAADIAGAYSFTEQMKSLGRHPDTRILSFEQIEADKFIAQYLNLSLGEAIYKLSRLRSADREPLMIEDTYLPVKLFMTLDDKLLRSKPLYDLLKISIKPSV